MSFTDRLLLWLHIGFAIFTLGPVTAAMMATPRYIRTGDLAVLRYLCRTTGIFGSLTVGVFLFGLLLGRNNLNRAWLTASMTLFVVSAALLVLVFRDQRRAIAAIGKAVAVGEASAGATAVTAATGTAVSPKGEGTPTGTAPAERAGAEPAGRGEPSTPAGDDGKAGDGRPGEAIAAAQASGDRATATVHAPGRGAAGGHVATVERGRIASLAGVISVIWLAILVLMVWNG